MRYVFKGQDHPEAVGQQSLARAVRRRKEGQEYVLLVPLDEAQLVLRLGKKDFVRVTAMFLRAMWDSEELTLEVRDYAEKIQRMNREDV